MTSDRIATEDYVDAQVGGTPGVLTSEQFTGDGAEDTFTLGNTPASAYAIVTVNGAQVTTYGISGDDVVFTTPPDTDAEIVVSYVYGGGIVTPPTAADVAVSPAVEGETNVQAALETLEGAMHIVGPFTVNYNSANVLTTGVTLWTPEAGYVIYNMWFVSPVAFTGSGGMTYIEILLLTANDVLFPSYSPSPYLFINLAGGGGLDTGVDVTRNVSTDVLAAQALSNNARSYFPTEMKATTPLKLKLAPDAGSMTAGQLKVYAMVGELA